MNWFNTILSVLLLLILIGIYNLPHHIYNLLEDRYKSKNNKQLQIESYFRQLSGSKQEEVLSKWMNFLTNMQETVKKYSSDTPQSKKLFRELLHDTMMYGSPQTIKLVGAFKNENTSEQSQINQRSTVLMAAIVCSLREDFTGYKSNPLDLLKITINDFDKYRNLYEEAWKQIQKEMM